MTTLTLLPPQPVDMPLMPLRDVVVFPHMVIPLFVGRPKSIKALEAAVGGERRIALVAQRTSGKDEPAMTDLYATGCICTVLQMLKLPDGTVKVLVQGQQRAALERVEDGEFSRPPYCLCRRKRPRPPTPPRPRRCAAPSRSSSSNQY